MNTELTDEQIADACKCGSYETCHECTMSHNKINVCLSILARALQAERAKKDDIWKDAPDWASVMLRYFKKEDGDPLDARTMQKLTRTLPKTLEQEIAEKYEKNIAAFGVGCVRGYSEYFQKMLKEYAERIKQ